MAGRGPGDQPYSGRARQGEHQRYAGRRVQPVGRDHARRAGGRFPLPGSAEFQGRAGRAARPGRSAPPTRRSDESLTLTGESARGRWRYDGGGRQHSPAARRRRENRRRDVCQRQRQDHLQRADAAAQRGAAGQLRSGACHRQGDERRCNPRGWRTTPAGRGCGRAPTSWRRRRIDFDQKTRTHCWRRATSKRPVSSCVYPGGRQGKVFDHAGDGAQAELLRQRPPGALLGRGDGARAKTA